MTRLLLVRHAAHDLTGKVLAGRMPGVTLSEGGRRQAEALADHVQGGAPPSALYCSPRDRCRETAAPIATRCGLAVETSDALDEIDFGDWTGRSFAALDRDPAWRAWNDARGSAAAPGGESAAAVAARVMGLLATLAAEEREPIVLVTHADVIRFAILSLLRAPLDAYDRLEIAPASITTVDLWPGGGKIVRTNHVVTA